MGAASGIVGVALDLLEDLLQSEYPPDDIVLHHLLEGCCHIGNADLGVHLCTDMVASGRIKPPPTPLPQW